MGAPELKDKLKAQFKNMLLDNSKLNLLDGIFDALNSENGNSKVPESYYKLVDERRKQYFAGETEGISWNDLKKNLKTKNGQ